MKLLLKRSFCVVRSQKPQSIVAVILWSKNKLRRLGSNLLWTFVAEIFFYPLVFSFKFFFVFSSLSLSFFLGISLSAYYSLILYIFFRVCSFAPYSSSIKLFPQPLGIISTTILILRHIFLY